MKIVYRIAIVIALLGCAALAQTASDFAANPMLSKGGFGIIRQDLFVDVKSPNNELLVYHQRWTGERSSLSQIAIFYEGRIYSHESLPDTFDLSKSIVISFESDKVRFFDFVKMSGGYYARFR